MELLSISFGPGALWKNEQNTKDAMNQERLWTIVINLLFFFFFTAYKKRKSKRKARFWERWMDSILYMQSQDPMDHLKKDTELWFREKIRSGADSIPKYCVESLLDCFG